MEKIKLAFICKFSNAEIRRHQTIKDFRFENFLLALLKKEKKKVIDYGPWIPLFLKAFENDNNIEVHVIAPYSYQKKKLCEFRLRNIYYHCVGYNQSSLLHYSKLLLSSYRKDMYEHVRNNIINVVNKINPNFICLSGAENMEYSPVVLQFDNIPVLVLMQTFLNSSLRKNVNFAGGEFRKSYERTVIARADYICYAEHESELVKAINNKNPLLKISFPTQEPVLRKVDVLYDFVFFSVRLTQKKGIEDAIVGLASVSQKYPNVKMCVIGGYDKKYKDTLDDLIRNSHLENNIIFLGLQESSYDVYNLVSSSAIAVLPGLTSVNSTVRESLFLERPVVTYKLSSDYELFSENGKYVRYADLGDRDRLGKEMLYCYENPMEMEKQVKRAYEYAQKNLSSSPRSQHLLSVVKASFSNYYYGTKIPSNLIV